MVKALTRSLTRRGIEIAVGARVESIADAGDQKRVTATTAEGPKTFDGEYVLVAVGRKANPAGLEKLIKRGAGDGSRSRRRQRAHGDQPAGRLRHRRSRRAHVAGARRGDRGRDRRGERDGPRGDDGLQRGAAPDLHLP